MLTSEKVFRHPASIVLRFDFGIFRFLLTASQCPIDYHLIWAHKRMAHSLSAQHITMYAYILHYKLRSNLDVVQVSPSSGSRSVVLIL